MSFRTTPRLGSIVRLCVAVILTGCGSSGAPGRPADGGIDQPVDPVAADSGADATAGESSDDSAVDAGAVDTAVDRGPPPPFSIRATRFEIVARDAEKGNEPPGAPGNNWGGQQSRIVRLADGEIYAAYMVSPTSGTDPSQAQWVLVRRGAGDGDGFGEVARRVNGREPMHVVRLPDDRVQVLAWPGKPAVWTVTTGASPSLAGPTAIPGGWQMLGGSSTPYGGAGIAPDGHLCFVASRADAMTMSGAMYSADSAWDFACRKPDGAWTPFTTLPFGLRYAYPYVVVATGGDWELTATRDVLWEAAGYTPPAGSFGYVLNVVDNWSFPDAAATAPARQELGRLEPGSGTNAVSFTVGDAMRDHLGRLHVLTRSRTSGGTWKMGHVLVRTDGTLARADVVVAGYTDGSIRLVQDDHDRFVLLFFQSGNTYAYPTTDADGLVLGPRTDLTSTFIRSGITRQSHVYVAAPRGGTAPGRFVDLLMDYNGSDGTAQIGYGRIEIY